MPNNFSILVGTRGAGLWRSPDGGTTWTRVMGRPLWPDSRVTGLTVHPTDPRIIYAGSDDGIFRSDNGGESFERLDSPMNDMDVWKIAVDPVDPDTIFAGTSPSALFRSKDGGRQWEKLSVDLAETCPNVRYPRVTALVVDPSDHRNVWAGIEVDGVRRSLDGGDTWTRIEGGLDDPDIHDMAISVAEPKTVFTATSWEVFASTDTGESWQGLGVGKQFANPYCRFVALKSGDPRVMFVAAGDGSVIGNTGDIQRSVDRGLTWESLSMPVEPNTPLWTVATHPADPDLILAGSHYGQLFLTSDGGDSWVKLRREVTDIGALAWVPN